MDGGFVLTVDGRGGSMPVVGAGDDGSPGESVLGFAPTGSARWSDATAMVSVTTWSGPRRAPESTLASSPSGATFVVGDVRMAGETWPDHRRWPRQLAAAAESIGAEQLQEQLRGVYAVGHVSTSGDGWVFTDPFGLRCLYYGQDGSRFVVATRAELVARALARSTEPAKDVDASTWLAYTAWWVGTATGYESVSTAPPGAILRIERGRCRWQANPYLAPADPPRRSALEVAPELVDDVADSLRAVLARPAERHTIQLTGGRDSRLILAVAIAAGLADRFTYVTSGPDELPDVQVARELADRFDLRHEIRFLGARRPGRYADHRRSWVHDVGGMVSAWDASRLPPADEILVSGVLGEFVRTFHRYPSGSAPITDSRKLVERSRPGRLGLLFEPVERRRHEELLEQVRPADVPAGDPLAEMHLFNVLHRTRFKRAGPRSEISAEERVLPLYSPVAIRAALAVPTEDREAEMVTLAMIHSCEPRLATHRLAGPAWDDRARRVVGVDATSAPPSPLPSSATTATPKRLSVVAGLHGSGSADRDDLFDEVLADGDNPIWELVDRSAVRAGADRWAALDPVERREVYGAISAAIWTGA